MWWGWAPPEGWTPPPPEPPGSGRERNYICRACAVHGKSIDDTSLTCWCCDSADHLDFDKVPGIVNSHCWVLRQPSDPEGAETVGYLVG